MTVREMVGAVVHEVLTSDLPPQRAAVLDTQLSALMANITKEIQEADVEFNLVYLGAMKTEGAANRAKVLAQTTPQYKRMREAHDLEKVTLNMIRSLRNLGRVGTETMRLQR